MKAAEPGFWSRVMSAPPSVPLSSDSGPFSRLLEQPGGRTPPDSALGNLSCPIWAIQGGGVDAAARPIRGQRLSVHHESLGDDWATLGQSEPSLEGLLGQSYCGKTNHRFLRDCAVCGQVGSVASQLLKDQCCWRQWD